MTRRNLFAKLAGCLGAICTGAVAKASPVKESSVVKDVTVRVKVDPQKVADRIVEKMGPTLNEAMARIRTAFMSGTLKPLFDERGKRIGTQQETTIIETLSEDHPEMLCQTLFRASRGTAGWSERRG